MWRGEPHVQCRIFHCRFIVLIDFAQLLLLSRHHISSCSLNYSVSVWSSLMQQAALLYGEDHFHPILTRCQRRPSGDPLGQIGELSVNFCDAAD